MATAVPLTNSTIHLKNTAPPYETNYRTPAQNHAAAKAWSLKINARILERPEIAYWISHWSSPRGIKKLQISLKRWHPYRRIVQKLIRESKLPWEILAIPMVESNWKIHAVSSSGAAGPWQFMEASARGRKLVIDVWRDERRDSWLATRAAMQELAFNYKLSADWLLSIASYNAGSTRIRNLMDESGLNNFWDMLDKGILPEETANYVPQVMAVAYILSHSGRFGLPLFWEYAPEWSTVELNRSLVLGYLANSTGIDPQILLKANRELLQPVTPPTYLPYLLKVPSQKAAEVEQWLQAAANRDEPQRFWRYIVKTGDHTSKIAKESNVPLTKLLRYNVHVNADNLRLGDVIYIPAEPGVVVPPAGMETDDLPDWQATYRVRPGESYWSISRQHNITPEKLAQGNSRHINDVLMAGSLLKVPEKLTEPRYSDLREQSSKTNKKNSTDREASELPESGQNQVETQTEQDFTIKRVNRSEW